MKLSRLSLVSEGMREMSSGEVVRGSGLLGLAALVCLLFSSVPASADQPAGQRYSWDSEPQFVNTSEGERVTFLRSTGDLDGGPQIEMMQSDYAGNNVSGLLPPGSNGSGNGPENKVDVTTARDTNLVEWTYGTKDGLCFNHPFDMTSIGCYFKYGQPGQQLVETGYAQPALSANGERVAFIDGTRLKSWSTDVTLNPTTQTLPPLPDAASPALSDDGSKVMFEGRGTESGQSQAGIWIVNSDGTGIGRRLTGTVSPNPCYRDSDPVWQPVLNEVVFVRNALACGDDDLAGLWRIAPDATWSDAAWPQGEQLVAGNPDDLEFSEPVASPNGNRIAFTRRSLVSGHLEAQGSTIRLYSEGSSFDRPIGEPGDTGIDFDSHPAFSANSSFVVFQRRADPISGAQDSMKSGIYLVDLDTVGNAQTYQLTKSFNYHQDACCTRKPNSLELGVHRSRITVSTKRPRFVQARISRDGDTEIANVVLCVKGPRVLRLHRKCFSFGGLQPGQSFGQGTGIGLKRPVRKGRKFSVVFTVRGDGVDPVSATVVVRAK